MIRFASDEKKGVRLQWDVESGVCVCTCGEENYFGCEKYLITNSSFLNKLI